MVEELRNIAFTRHSHVQFFYESIDVDMHVHRMFSDGGRGAKQVL